MSTPKQAFVPHKNVPGPPRLQMAVSDYSGTVNTDPAFIADRLAIINHISAYAYLIDEGRYDEWFELFTDDISFETTAPEVGTLILKGKAPFQQFVHDRYVVPGKTSKGVRRHTQGNIHVAAQTADTAKARTYMFISSVPKADHLHMVTSGTYNADLRKVDGKWKISRWYIEVDCPLSPSPLPEGFSPEEVIVALDPSTFLPGAPEVAEAVPGKITLANHPFSTPANGPLYANAPVWNWTDVDIIIVDYLTTAAAAAEFLPAQCTTVPIPELPGYALIKLIWAKYRDTSFGPYNELMPTIPCLYNGQPFIHVPLIYVDNDCAMAAGRETGGWPKKLAKIDMERTGNEYRCSFERGGEQLVSTKVDIEGPLFSTPLPADKPVTLPFPYNMTLPLPPPTGKEQESLPFPTTTIKLVPAVDGGAGTPSVARLIGSPWHMTGTFSKASNASVAFRKSENDPFYKLPILKILGAMFLEGDMTLKFSEMTVLVDLLKSNGGPPKK